MGLDHDDAAHFRAAVRERTGISLEAGKDYLIETRLAPIAASSGRTSVSHLLQDLRSGRHPLSDAILEAMTTNETFFFRDATPFEHLRRLLSEAALKGGACRVWSAACSTGQEAYSLAMIWEDLPRRSSSARLEIVASDISETCLRRARAGVYTSFEVKRGLSSAQLQGCFDAHPDGWVVKPHLRQAITWRHHNLLDRPSALGRFDIILCRNVLIYFEPENRRRVLGNLAQASHPGACLIMGASETVLSVSDRYTASNQHPGLYRLAA